LPKLSISTTNKTHKDSLFFPTEIDNGLKHCMINTPLRNSKVSEVMERISSLHGSFEKDSGKVIGEEDV
jgi:hypothetical protein